MILGGVRGITYTRTGPHTGTTLPAHSESRYAYPSYRSPPLTSKRAVPSQAIEDSCPFWMNLGFVLDEGPFFFFFYSAC